MKKKSLLLFSFVILYNLVVSQETFLKIYPSPEDQQSNCIVETDDNHLILCGTSSVNSDQLTQIGTLIKMNMNGEVLQMSIHNNILGDSYYARLKNSEGTSGLYYLLGGMDTVMDNQIVNMVFINSIDNNLNLITSRNYGNWTLTKNYPQDFEIVGDSVAFIMSLLVHNNNSILDYSLTKANLMNNNYLYYTPEDNKYRMPSGLILDETNNILKISYKAGYSSPYGINPLVNISTDLTSIEEVLVDNDFFTQTRIAKKMDTSYFLSGSKIYDFNPLRELGIAEYNLNDSLLRQTIFPGHADTMTYPGAGQSMLVTTDNIWVVGWYNIIEMAMPCSPEPTWVILNRLNHNLELQEQFFYGGDGVYFPRYIIETSDHHIVVTGEYYDPELIPYECQFDPFVLKVNSEGLIVNTTNHDLPIAQEAIVFPNPGSGYLQVKLAIQHPQATLELFDMNGRLILTEEINTDMQQVNTAFLPAGIYPYRITTSGKVIGNGKWVKE